MVKIILLILYLFIKLLCVQSSQLLLVQILFRHGDRTPLGTYPTDPYGDPSYWPNGFGQLTNRGKQQQFAFGQWLRNRYREFLPEKYNLNDIYVFSTNYDRTLMSAEANLAGLYPPNGTDVWSPDLKWQPIPVHTESLKHDVVLAVEKKCPRYDAEFQKIVEIPEISEAQEEVQPLFKYVSNHTNANISTLGMLTRIYDNLFIQSLYNFKLPDWTKDVFPSQMRRWVSFSFKLNAYNIELQRLHIGVLLNEIMNRFVNKSKTELVPNRKMWMYSGHDANLVNLLMALGAYNDKTPPYASAVIFELFKNDDSYYISAFYKNDTTSNQPYPISILGCELFCPLDKVLSLLEPVLLDKDVWEAECQQLPVPKVLTVVAIIGICCGVLLVVVLVSVCCYKNLLRKNFHIN